MIKRLILSTSAFVPKSTRYGRFFGSTSAGEPAGPVKLGYPFSIPTAKQVVVSVAV